MCGGADEDVSEADKIEGSVTMRLYLTVPYAENLAWALAGPKPLQFPQIEARFCALRIKVPFPQNYDLNLLKQWTL